MSIAFANMWQEITLVLFTTLAPAATAACLIAALPLLSPRIDYDVRYSVAKSFSIPLAIASIGLVFSATHLGNPSNALYVFAGVGRSPLSNEVFSAAVFLLCAGTFWMASFSREHHVRVVRVWYAVCVATGALFIAAVAFAYHVETILTWYVSNVPASIVLNAAFMGPVLGLATLHASLWEPVRGRLARTLLAVASVALVLGAVNYALLGVEVMGRGNALFRVVELVPFYWAGVGAFVLMGTVALGLSIRALACTGLRRTLTAASACAAGFFAVFVMRALFYLMHITVGVGI